MAALVLRWIGRLTTLVVVAFVALSATVPSGSPSTVQLVALSFFPGMVCTGMLLAWWREGLGALVATMGLAAFYAWSLLSGAHFARGPWFIVCWAPTLFFGGSWLLRHRLKHGTTRSRA